MIEKAQRYILIIVILLLVQVQLGQATGDIQWLTTFVTLFTAILLEAVPFMLIGSVVSGLIEVFVPRELISQRIFRKRFFAIPVFGLLGILFPVCECGIVPVIRRLLDKGVPLSCGITYMLAAPIVQPIVFVSTLVAFNGSWKVAGLRIIGGYLTAVLIGMLATFCLDPHSKEHLIFQNKKATEEETTACCDKPLNARETDICKNNKHSSDCHIHTANSRGLLLRICIALAHAADDFLATGSYLIFGAFLAAGMQTFISQDALLKLGEGPIQGPIVMMAIAFVISLCAAADAFVAAAFVQFPIAARMAFLVMGPMVDIKLLAMYSGFLSKKATAFVFGLATLSAFAYAVLLRHLGV
jgi:uncharacterized membrane protein YraQ (UPF0718 family)